MWHREKIRLGCHPGLCMATVAAFFALLLTLEAAPKNGYDAPTPFGKDMKGFGVRPTYLIGLKMINVERGGNKVFSIDAVPVNGGEVRFEISRPPGNGSLSKLEKSSSSQVFLYSNDRNFKTNKDSFDLRVQAPGHSWSTHTVKFKIEDPPGQLVLTPEDLKFGDVPVGSTSLLTLVLSNSFGRQVSGTLLVPSPWKIPGGGSFSLAEGESQSVEIVFAPSELGDAHANLRPAPEIKNFPSIPLVGRGLAPFLLSSTSAVVTPDMPIGWFQLTNDTTSSVTLEMHGDPELDFSPPVVLLPGKAGGIWVSSARLNLPAGANKIFRLQIDTGHYAQPVELSAHGPVGGLLLELRKEIIPASLAKPLQLEGFIHNTSADDHSVELFLQDHEGAMPKPVQYLTIGAGRKESFSVPWSPSLSGLCAPSLHLMESGKEMGSASWRVCVDPPAGLKSPPSGSPIPSVPTLSPQSHPVTPGPSTVLASESQKKTFVVWQPPYFEEGLFRRSLVLKWNYYASDRPTFFVTQRIENNALVNRAGEDVDPWRPLNFNSSQLVEVAQGTWKLTIPMPFPGLHEYQVAPKGPGERLVATMPVVITWGDFLWPILRLSLWILFLVALLKVIRRRMVIGS